MDCATWDNLEWQSDEKALSGIKSLIKEVPDFPKVGINFRDIMPVFQVPNAVVAIVDMMSKHIDENFKCVEVIVGLEAHGFMIGTMIALKLHKPFIPIRKQGKLPGECISVSSRKGYGGVIEIQKDVLKPHQKVVIVDDLMATGGSLKNSVELVKKCGADVLGCIVLSELIELNGRDNLDCPFHSFIQ